MAKPFVIPLFLPHSGCPHRCVFCNQKAITQSRSDSTESGRLAEQIEQFLCYKKENRKGVEIAFYGGSFLGLSPERIRSCLDIAGSFAERGGVDAIRFSTRPDTVTEESLDLLQDYPVTTVEIGAQSMADHILALSGRGHWAEDTRRAADLLKNRGFRTGIQMMVGLPGDNPFFSAFTARQIAALSPDFTRIYPTLVVKGSRLADWYANGRYRPLCLEESVKRVAMAYRIFEKNKVPVIRMGLQTSGGLFADSVLAGPLHPAFGHMVHSAIMLEKAQKKISALRPAGDSITLRVHPRSYSRLQGLNRKNIALLKGRFRLSRIRLFADPMLPEYAVELAD
jgi:histone acetyltransferase (RNA polymerase elongator complex component)